MDNKFDTKKNSGFAGGPQAENGVQIDNRSVTTTK